MRLTCHQVAVICACILGAVFGLAYATDAISGVGFVGWAVLSCSVIAWAEIQIDKREQRDDHDLGG